MKKSIFSVVVCLAFLLTSVQVSVVQAQAPGPEGDFNYRLQKIIGQRRDFDWPVMNPDDLPEDWHHPRFDEIREIVHIPPTEESLRLTQEQVQGFSCSTVTDVPRVECEALVALYESTNGEDWTDHSNWLQSTTVDDWYGIYISEGHITEIDLLQNNLSGVLPAALGNLAHLEYLDFSNNYLTGAIPATLGNLANLRYLYLFYNELTGPIPAELGNLSHLIYLILHGNQLTGTIPATLGNLLNLDYLDLSVNQLTGTIPATLGNLSNTQYLHIFTNQLTGPIPAELGKLSKIKSLF
ncbi:MAG: hypothetical protein GX884_05490, partial [Chloroflexi bacterium]|nr:hypothetical protein [Chloroflexota bacterium]